MANHGKISGLFKVPIRYRLRRNFLRLPPLIVWTVALLVTLFLYLRQERVLVVTGFAGEESYAVTVPAPCRLQQIHVALHQTVEKGQVLATLAPEEVRLELETAQQELVGIQAELGREEALWSLQRSQRESDQQAQLRRFARDVEMSYIDYLKGLTDLAEDRIQVQGLKLQYTRTKALESKDMAAQAILDQERIAYEAMEEKIKKTKPWVEELNKRHQAMDSRYRAFLVKNIGELPNSTVILKPLQSALKAQELRIKAIDLALSRLTLRSPARGVVSQILRQPGADLVAGEPIISIVNAQATEVVAYLTERNMLLVKPGDEVNLRRLAAPLDQHLSKVEVLGAQIVQVPIRANAGSVIPLYGLPVHIPLPDTLTVRPGEAFEVVFPLGADE